MKIPPDIRKLIESGTPAHLVTLNRDGSPQMTLIWVGLDGDDIVAGHLPESRKVKNIRRDPRVAISLQANTKSSMGLTEYAVLYGEAHIEAGDYVVLPGAQDHKRAFDGLENYRGLEIWTREVCPDADKNRDSGEA